jgi:hypothetical protein
LKNRNRALKEAIDQMEAKKKELEAKLQQPQPAEAPAAEEEAEQLETAGAVTMTVATGSVLAESPGNQEKKKHRFF